MGSMRVRSHATSTATVDHTQHSQTWSSSVAEDLNAQATQVSMIRNVVLDGSGTTMDPHVIAPALAFVEVMRNYHGLEITMEQARIPMGNLKRIHQRKLYALPEVKEQFRELHGREPTAQNSDEAFDALFNETQNAILKRPEISDLLPGVGDVIHNLLDSNVNVGFITGFMRSNVDVIKLESFIKQGIPDGSITFLAGDDVPDELGCRPSPHLLWQCLLKMGATDPSYCTLGVDDTVAGIGSIIRGGAWSLALYADSNYTNVDSHEQWTAMSAQERDDRRQQSLEKLKAESGAHYIAPNMTYLPMVMHDINMRMHDPDNRNLPQSSMGFRDGAPFYRGMGDGAVLCRV